MMSAIGLAADDDFDLSVAKSTVHSVSILFNRGDGTFTEDELYRAGDAPVSVAVGDLDGDGNLDLTLANAGSVNVSVLHNQ